MWALFFKYTLYKAHNAIGGNSEELETYTRIHMLIDGHTIDSTIWYSCNPNDEYHP